MVNRTPRTSNQFVKQEAVKVLGGFVTPNESMSDTGTITPKQEGIEMSLSFSDITEGTFYDSFKSHHGLPQDLDPNKGYAMQAKGRNIRSDAPSIRTSRQPSHSHETAHHTAMAALASETTGLEFVGKKVKVLVDAINDLRKFGLDHVVQLPELVLVGDQSSGKSSLMSALTEVQLPRAQGVCTKCPSNIKTSPADSWSCKVSLQQYFKYDNPRGRHIDSRSVTKKNRFPPWVEQKLEVKQFKTIFEKSQLEEVLRWAQIALLNHDQDHALFVPGSGSRAQPANFETERKHTEAGFSPNVIAVEISGPNLPALSFYDLPGIFQVTPDPKDQYLATVVKNLAIKYIQHPNALIIWALAMKTDPSNSLTGKVIVECNAQDRCIGVLTNPDHIQVRHIEFENMLRNLAHVVRHGYFVTKQPGEGSNICGPDYHALARKEETEFFDTDSLWTGEWSEFRNRCGTLAIQNYLSQQFAAQIAKSIPDITEKIEARTEVVDADLRALPELPHADILNTVQRCLVQFSIEAQRLMDGDSVSTQINLKGDWKKLSEQFRSLILHVRPMITLCHESDKDLPDVIEILDDEDEDGDELPRTPPQQNRKHPSPLTVHGQAKRQRLNDGAVPIAMTYAPKLNGTIHTPQNGHSLKDEPGNFPSPGPRIIPAPAYRAVDPKPNPFLGTPFEDFANMGKGFIDIGGIRTYIADFTRAGLPGVVNDNVYDQLCMLSVQPWKGPLEIFIRHTTSMLHEQFDAILSRNLGQYRQTELYKSAEGHLHEFLDKYVAEQRLLLDELFKLETYKSFTINSDAILEQVAKELHTLNNTRRNVRAHCYVQKQIKLGLEKKLPTELSFVERKKGMQKKADAVKDEQLGKDPFDLEIRVAAYVRGYYAIAGNRFADSACLSIYGKLFRDIRDNILFYLENKLSLKGDGAEERCRRLMEEDDTIGYRRRILREEKEALTGFSRRLASLEKEAREVDSNQAQHQVQPNRTAERSDEL